MSLRTRLAIVLAAAAGLVVLAVAQFGSDSRPSTQRSTGARAQAGPPFVGLASPELIALPEPELGRTLDEQLRLRIGLVRQTFDWATIEPARDRYDFTSYDRLMAALAERRLEMLPVLFNPPPFRSSRPERGAREGTYPPRRYADMGTFAAALVKRYGPAGTFWSERPELPEVPIRSWQVWNEPSLPAYWPEGPDPAEYGRLLAATAKGIRAADPRATVVSAGLPQSKIGVPFARYVNGLYRAGARDAFDVFAVHAYASDTAGMTAAVAEARRLMARNGDRRPIWVTEIGWASGGPPSSFTVGARGQARRVSAAITGLAGQARRLGLRGFVYATWRDGTVYEGGSDFWGLHTGLMPVRGAPKPAYYAFERAAQRVPGLLSRGRKK